MDDLFTSSNLKGSSDIFGSLSAMLTNYSSIKDINRNIRETAEIGTQQLGLSSEVKQRRQGAIRSAYAKSGVELSGTAKAYLEKQQKLDEIDLLNRKYNLDKDIKTQYKQSRALVKENIISAVKVGITGLKMDKEVM